MNISAKLIVLFAIAIYCQFASCVNINGNVNHVKRVTTLGFSSQHSFDILSRLLNKKVVDPNCEISVEWNNLHSKLLLSEFRSGLNPEIVLLHLEESSFLNMDELSLSIANILDSWRSNLNSKLNFVVLFSSVPSSRTRIFESLVQVLNDAWSLSSKNAGLSTEISSIINLNIFPCTYSGEIVSRSASDVIRGLIGNLSYANATIDENSSFSSNYQKKMRTSTTISGVELLSFEVNRLFSDFQSIFRANVTEYQQPSFRPSFKNQIEAILVKYSNQLENYYLKRGGKKNIILKSAIVDLQTRILTAFQPLFLQHAMDIRREITEELNRRVNENIDTTIHIMRDLMKVRDEVLELFKMQLNSMIPKQAAQLSMLSWRSEVHLRQLKERIDDYLVERESLLRFQGVLPRRNWPPLKIRFDTLLLHPLGRDYRQDPLCYRNERDGRSLSNGFDRPIMLSADQEDTLVSPNLVRDLMTSVRKKAKKEKTLPPVFGEQNYEFAREMLMLPLSIKDPKSAFVDPIKSDRECPPPRWDTRRHIWGPER